MESLLKMNSGKGPRNYTVVDHRQNIKKGPRDSEDLGNRKAEAFANDDI